MVKVHRWRRMLLLGGSLALAACGAVIENSLPSPWIWHCQERSETGEWSCRRVQLQDGRLPRSGAQQPQAVDSEAEPRNPKQQKAG